MFTRQSNKKTDIPNSLILVQNTNVNSNCDPQSSNIQARLEEQNTKTLSPTQQLGQHSINKVLQRQSSTNNPSLKKTTLILLDTLPYDALISEFILNYLISLKKKVHTLPCTFLYHFSLDKDKLQKGLDAIEGNPYFMSILEKNKQEAGLNLGYFKESDIINILKEEKNFLSLSASMSDSPPKVIHMLRHYPQHKTIMSLAQDLQKNGFEIDKHLKINLESLLTDQTLEGGIIFWISSNIESPRYMNYINKLNLSGSDSTTSNIMIESYI